MQNLRGFAHIARRYNLPPSQPNFLARLPRWQKLSSVDYLTYYSLTVLTGTQFTPIKSVSREPWILPLPETSSITLIWWHVKCTASQNKWCNPSHKPKHIFNWTYFRFLFTVIHRSVVILLRKSKTDGAIQTNMIFMDPVWDSFPFCMRRLRTVQSQTGTKITRVGSATDTVWVRF